MSTDLESDPSGFHETPGVRSGSGDSRGWVAGPTVSAARRRRPGPGAGVGRAALELNQCHLRHRLDLAKAEAPNLSLRGSYLRAQLSGRRLRLTHGLNLSSGFRWTVASIFERRI